MTSTRGGLDLFSPKYQVLGDVMLGPIMIVI